MTGTADQGVDLGHVLNRFPALADLASRLAAESETFRSLCEDYALAVDALRRLDRMGSARDANKVAEYRALVLDLEREIGESLNNAKH